MSAFEPTTLRPDAPAMPSINSRQPSAQQLAFDPYAKASYSEGLTARQHAAIALCVPDSGCDWLDAMIEQRRRDEFAKAALAALIANPCKEDFKRGAKGVPIMAGYAFEYSDAMLAAIKKEPE